MPSFETAEGPVLAPLLFAAALVAVVYAYRRYVSAPLSFAGSSTTTADWESDPKRPDAWRQHLRDSMAVLRLGGSLLLLAVFAFASARVDQTENGLVMFGFAVLCWAVFLFVVFSLFEMARVAATRFGVVLNTGLHGLNLLLGFLIGERILTLLLFAMGGLGFRLGVTLIISLVAAWAVKRFFSPSLPVPIPVLTIGLDPRSANPIPRSFAHHVLSHAPVLISVAVVLTYLGWTMFYNIHRPMSSWDNYTQWLVVPFEMLTNNRVIGFYDVTRSVAPSYPPQQSISSAFLLFLWGDTNGSENLLNIYNPFLMGLGLFALGSFIRSRTEGFILPAVLILTVVGIAYLPVTFRLSGYADTRSVMCLLAICIMVYQTREYGGVTTAVKLAVFATVVFTCKPYIWPFALLPFLFFLLNGWKWRSGFVFVVVVLVLACLDIYIIQAIAPEVRVLSIDSVSTRLADTLVSAFVPDLDAIRAGIALQQNNAVILRATLLVSSILLVLGVALWSRADLRDGLLASGLAMLGLTILLMIVLNQLSGFGNSLYRYLLSGAGALVFGVTILVTGLVNRRLRFLQPIAFVAALVFAVVWLPKSPQSIETEWYKVRLASLKPFPTRSLSGHDYLEEVLQEHGSAKDSIGIVIHPFESNLEQYYINYLLARMSISIYSHAATVPGGPAGPLLSADSPGAVDAYFTERDVDVVVFRENAEVLGHTYPAGVYTTFELGFGLNGVEKNE